VDARAATTSAIAARLAGADSTSLADAGKSQRAIARELNIDRRKVRQIIGRAA
jgi:DNA-binding CsgD family transcriptional regulator